MSVMAADKQSLSNASQLISNAVSLLLQASRASTDPVALLKIHNEIVYLNTITTNVAQIMVIADDATFDTATAALKQQAATLQSQAEAIGAVAADAATAAQITGWIVQAVAFIAVL